MTSARKSPVDVQQRAMIARMRLKQAGRWFAHQNHPPASQSVLKWTACQAWLSAPANPSAAVRSVLKRLVPTLSTERAGAILNHTRHHVSRWSSDQCAYVLGISVWDREALKLWHLGAIDDYDYAIRHQLKAQKSAARVAKFRAKNVTLKPRGRPRKELTPTQIDKRMKRRRKMTANRVKKHRKCNAEIR